MLFSRCAALENTKAMMAGGVFLLCACASDVTDAYEDGANRGQIYGPDLAIVGTYAWTFESSELYICDDMPQICTNKRKYRQGCWLKFEPDALQYLTQWEKENSTLSPIAGKASLSGRGRVLSGKFMGNYACQINITSISRFDVIQQVTDR